MAQSQADQSGSTPAPSADLGANEWLVEEMREQYDKDPGSVGPQWAAYFGGSASNGSSNGAAAAGPRAPRRRPPRSRRPSPPAAAPPAAQAPAAGKPAAAAPPPADARRRQLRPPSRPPSRAPPARPPSPPRAPRTPVAKDAEAGRARRGERRADATPRCAASRPPPRKNMDASLTVPDRHVGAHASRSSCCGTTASSSTTTSTAPAAARSPSPTSSATRWSRRIKVDAGDEQRLRRDRRQADPGHAGPHQPRPRHRPAEARRHPPARRARRIKGCETMDFAGFWTAYEEIVRKARDNKLTMDDYSGTTDQPDQRRRPRHQPLGAAADARPGRHHRRRRDGLPAGVAGRLRGDPQPQRRSARS